MKKKNKVWILIAIAVLVLFVGSFFLIEAGITGEAVASRECKKLEKCGFASKEDAQKLTSIEFNEIKKFYGDGNFQLGKSAESICHDLSCGGCFASQIQKMNTYFESKDGSCKDSQLDTFDEELAGCEGMGSYGDCGISDVNKKEPGYGDHKYQQILTGVICTGCPTTLLEDLKALPWPEGEVPTSTGGGSAGGSGGSSS